ncbi:MAG: DUF898 family protein [Albidovulum sp.]
MSDIKRVWASYSGAGQPLFGLAFVTSLLTIVTLGIYRFWAKTRIRKYIWSSVQIGNDRLEYTGTGLEKFLGFLIAVVVLAVYLGLVQMILFYFGLRFVFEPQTVAEFIAQVSVFYISFFAVIPLMLFARYRARRYLMARTRLRGIRFGMDKAAWGYVWRAILHGLASFASLGILLPRQTFYLEKYKTDRSYYGDQRFEQNGRWTELYPAMLHIFIGAGLIIAGITVSILTSKGSWADGNGTPGIFGVLLSVMGYIWGLLGYIHYRVRSFSYLTKHKVLASNIGFHAVPSTGAVIEIYILGALGMGLLAALAMLFFGIVFGFLANEATTFAGASPGMAGIIMTVLAYMGALALFGSLALVLITQPIIAHFVDALAINNPQALDTIVQRAHDAGADAEGFADALDIGSAI